MGRAQVTPALAGGPKKPKALVIVHEDGSSTEFPFTWPPDCYGFTFTGNIGEIMRVAYNCYPRGDAHPTEGGPNAEGAESP